jgi:hypothetical protein
MVLSIIFRTLSKGLSAVKADTTRAKRRDRVFCAALTSPLRTSLFTVASEFFEEWTLAV